MEMNFMTTRRFYSCCLVLSAALAACTTTITAVPPTPPAATVAQTSTPVATPAPTTMSVAPRSLFYDQFTSVKGEWQQVSGIWETRTDKGLLIQKTDDPRQLNAVRYVQTPRIADATIETAVSITPTRPLTIIGDTDAQLARDLRYIIGAGLVFRMKDSQNYYMFRLAGEEGAVVGKMVNGEWNDLCNPRVRDFLDGSRIGFTEENRYRLKVEVYGNRITAFIDDEPVCRVTDETFSIGNVGVVTFKTPADFDYLKVTNKEESEVRSQ
jgi:hypothetical protein